MRDGKLHHNRVIQFYAEAGEGEFLFDAEVVEKADELYRSEHRNVQIVTYDEVFEKIKTLVEILEGKD